MYTVWVEFRRGEHIERAVVDSLLPRVGIDDGRRDCGEVALPLGRSWDADGYLIVECFYLAFISEKEECLVLFDRTANTCSEELVLQGSVDWLAG